MNSRDDANLPDDPRDCCRAAMNVLIGNKLEDAETLVRDVLSVTFAALGSDDESDERPERLRSLIYRAERAMDDLISEIDRVRALLRHSDVGTREMHERSAERAKAIDEGREPPYEPTGYEVHGAMVASEAA